MDDVTQMAIEHHDFWRQKRLSEETLLETQRWRLTLTDPRYLTTFGSTRSEIIVPVFGEREVVTGLIDVESEQQNAFSETDRAFLEESAAAIRGLWRER